MENLFGIIFFLVVMAISYYSNQKTQQEEEKKRQQQKKVRPEDLPEATRRMLYGDNDGEIPTAQPRTAEPRTAEPRRADKPTAPPFVQGFPQTAKPRNAAPAPHEPKPVPPKYQAAPLRPTMAPPPQAQPTMRQAPPPQTQPQGSMQEMWQRAQAAQQLRNRQIQLEREQKEQARRKAASPRLQQQATAQRAQKAQRTQDKNTAAVQRSKQSIHLQELFGDINSVRRGIIMQEVLGTPKGLQGF